MLVAIAICQKDQDQAERLASWLAELGPYPTHRLIVARDHRAKEHVFDNAGFASVKEIVVTNDVWNSWPRSCNNAFRVVGKHIEATTKEPWLWIEADVAPISQEWLDKIEAEYQSCKKSFMGALVRVKDVPMHMTGVAVYPGQLSHFAGTAYLASDIAWDCYAAPQIVRQAHFTKLIQHNWKSPSFESLEQVEKDISPETVLFHGVKNNSLIDLLRQRKNNLPVPVLAESGSVTSREVEADEARENTTVERNGSNSCGGQFISVPDCNQTSREADAEGAETFDLFIKSYPPDYPWLKYCLRSIDKFAGGFRQVVLITPAESNVSEFLFDIGNVRCPKIVEVSESGSDGYLSQQVFKLHADTFSDAGFIIHVDSDTIFTKPVTPKTYFTDGLIDWMFTPYSMVETPWQPITEKFLGLPVEFEFMRRAPVVLPRWIYSAIRNFCVQKHGRTLDQYIMEQPHRAFSEYNALGAFAYYFHHDKFNWINTGKIPESEWPTLTVIQKKSWDGLTPEIEAEFSAILDGEIRCEEAPLTFTETLAPIFISGLIDDAQCLADRLKALCTSNAETRRIRRLLHDLGIIVLPYRFPKRKGWRKLKAGK